MSKGLKTILWIAAILVIGYFGLGFLGAVMQAAEDSKTKKVHYVVTCAACDLTYANANGDTEQIDVRDKWELDFTGKHGQFLYLSAQNKYGGEVRVEIDLDGMIAKISKSEGQFKIASASMRCE